MKLLNRLERKFGDWAIPHITMYLVALQGLTFFMVYVQPEIILKLRLTHDQLFSGEWWRLFTFVVMPPMMYPIFLIFYLYFFVLMGSALETQWGTFRYNLFLLVGYLATVLAALIPGANEVSNTFFTGSVFLAFAWLFPDFQILLFFIIPVAVKWLGLLAWIGFFMAFLIGNWTQKAEVTAGVLNFLLFFHDDLRLWVKTSGRKFKGDMIRARDRDPKPPMHVCAECGVSDQTDRKMEFRYCPQCKGTPAYCINHINNHKHR
jgi:hypothetical protein